MAATPAGSTADGETDRLYAALRDRHGTASARANGYRYHGYFLSEQAMVLGAIDGEPGLVLDVACGSGLMVRPLAERGWQIVGIDFNEQACQDARQNKIPVARADAFGLPLRSNSVDVAVSCQFLNQQSHDHARRFVHEAGRVLQPDGRLIIVWRNGKAVIHRVAHGAYGLWDRLHGRPVFPQVHHSLAQIRRYAEECGLVVDLESVTFPPLRWQSRHVTGPAAFVLGASFFVVLRKALDPARCNLRAREV